MPFLELTAAHPATQKRGRGLLRLAVVVEERNAPTAAGSGLGRKPGQPFLSWPLALFFPPFPKQLFVRSRRASGQSAWPGVQSPKVTWLYALGCRPTTKVPFSAKGSSPRASASASTDSATRERRLMVGAKSQKETTQLERTAKMQRRSLLRCQRVGGSG